MDVEDFLAAMQFGHQHESCCQLHSKTAQLREALRLKKAGMSTKKYIIDNEVSEIQRPLHCNIVGLAIILPNQTVV